MRRKKIHKRKILKVTTPTLKKPMKKGGIKQIIPRGELVFAPKNGRIQASNHFLKVPSCPSMYFSDKEMNKIIDSKSLKIPKPRIALILHLYYKDVSNHFLFQLNELKDQMSFDLYVSVVKGSKANTRVIKEAYEELGAHVREVPNAGKDILPKLTILNELVQKRKKYDYVFLLHDKKSPSYERDAKAKWMDTWRYDLTSLLFDNSLREQCLFTLHKFPQVGILGHLKHMKYGPGWHRHLYGHRRYLNESRLIEKQDLLQTYLKISSPPKLTQKGKSFLSLPSNQTWFIGGTMFWIRWDVIESFMNRYKVDSLLLALKKERGDVKDPSLTHACERFFGHIASLAGKKVFGYGKR